jgi:hypothetical protein
VSAIIGIMFVLILSRVIIWWRDREPAPPTLILIVSHYYYLIAQSSDWESIGSRFCHILHYVRA